MQLADKWTEYSLIDAGDGEKLEKWGDIILTRPDPQAIWPRQKENSLWYNADACYHRSKKGGGYWENKKNIPKRWEISYKNLRFFIEPTGFKHTGLFPEQAVNWDWMIDKIKNSDKKNNILNLFAYTGGATVACASAGASVCHVDAAKGMVQRAKENLSLSGLEDRQVRFITDDVIKFVKREIRRNNSYDGIIMDPPSYGRGPNGEVWQIEEKLYELIEISKELLSEKPLFFIVNMYTTGLSGSVIKNIMEILISKDNGGEIFADETGIPVKDSNIILPCGMTIKWIAEK
jgi:23S rRNA (cytosine1962-C5)-methyltransferase